LRGKSLAKVLQEGDFALKQMRRSGDIDENPVWQIEGDERRIAYAP
jgi:hypothetical protein